MYTFRKGLVPLLVVLVAVFAFGMGDAYADNDTLVVGTSAEGSDLDPRIATDTPAFKRIHTMMEPLISFANDMSLTPRLARSWEFSDDGLEITFYLREGVTFHHGREFTAEDVRYTFDWVLDEGNVSGHRGLFADITELEIIDDYTIVFHLEAPNGFLINNIARMPIVPYDKGDDAEFGRNPVGTGPYVFESWQRDEQLVVTAYDDYWGEPAQTSTVIFRPIPEDATRLLAFEAGEIDLFPRAIVPSELPRLEEDSRFELKRIAAVGYVYLGFNMKNEVLADKRVRQAINHLVNREGVVDVLMNGMGREGISMISPQLPWFNDEVKRYPYDADRARELLTEAGVVDSGVTLRVHTDEDSVRMLTAEILEFELGQLGIEVVPIHEELNAFVDRMLLTDDYEMFLFGWSGQVDPDRAMSRQFHTEGSHNFANYSNPRVDELIELGRITPADSQESIDIYSEAQEIIVEESPFAFVNYNEEVGIKHAYISNWDVHPHGAAGFQDVHLVKKDK